MPRETYRIEIETNGRGFYRITDQLHKIVREARFQSGILLAFILHTSASIVIQEEADPTSRSDMETFMRELKEQIHYNAQHTTEGPDDSFSHVRAAITGTVQTLIVEGGNLVLGEWQGVFIWEHRDGQRKRCVVVKLVES